MTLLRPVADKYPISAPYGKWGPYWSKCMDENGCWATGQVKGLGQHKGVDFAVPEGTPVFAMADGVITRSGWENPKRPKQGFGIRIRQHVVYPGGKSETLVYGHLQATRVKAGDRVRRGDRIGFSGNTGHTSGPHLHVERVDVKGQYHNLAFISSSSNLA